MLLEYWVTVHSSLNSKVTLGIVSECAFACTECVRRNAAFARRPNYGTRRSVSALLCFIFCTLLTSDADYLNAGGGLTTIWRVVAQMAARFKARATGHALFWVHIDYCEIWYLRSARRKITTQLRHQSTMEKKQHCLSALPVLRTETYPNLSPT